MDAAAVGYLVGSVERDANKMINSLKEELRALRAEMARGNNQRTDSQFTTIQYDWGNPQFQNACKEIKDDFFKRHPEIIRGSGQFQKMYPEKYKGVEILDRMSELNRIHPDEFLLLFKQIFDF